MTNRGHIKGIEKYLLLLSMTILGYHSRRLVCLWRLRVLDIYIWLLEQGCPL